MAANPISIWQVDAFTNRPFAGNPAAVCFLDGSAGDEWMQAVAGEMNLAETAFVCPKSSPGEFDLRWFTPSIEVDLCGHATLATAHALWQRGLAPANGPIRFHTASGPLTCRNDDGWYTLDFPATPPGGEGDVDPAIAYQLKVALGIQQASVTMSRFDYVLELPSVDAVDAVRPNYVALEAIETRGVMVTAHQPDDTADFVSRFFAPRCGITEDPVTGSAHCALAPYWGQRLNQDRLVGHQRSRRGGFVRCVLAGNRVQLTGQAVTVLKGELIGDA